MSVLKDLEKVVAAVKQEVVGHLDSAKIKTGTENPFGDKTLLLDMSQCRMNTVKVVPFFKNIGFR